MWCICIALRNINYYTLLGSERTNEMLCDIVLSRGCTELTLATQ